MLPIPSLSVQPVELADIKHKNILVMFCYQIKVKGLFHCTLACAAMVLFSKSPVSFVSTTVPGGTNFRYFLLSLYRFWITIWNWTAAKTTRKKVKSDNRNSSYGKETNWCSGGYFLFQNANVPDKIHKITSLIPLS